MVQPRPAARALPPRLVDLSRRAHPGRTLEACRRPPSSPTPGCRSLSCSATTRYADRAGRAGAGVARGPRRRASPWHPPRWLWWAVARRPRGRRYGLVRRPSGPCARGGRGRPVRAPPEEASALSELRMGAMVNYLRPSMMSMQGAATAPPCRPDVRACPPGAAARAARRPCLSGRRPCGRGTSRWWPAATRRRRTPGRW